MTRKSLIKKVAVLSMAVAMSLSMVACDKEKDDKTEKEITTEAPDTEAKTEEKTEAEATQDEDGEAASTEAYVEDNGKLTVKHVTMDVPEGYEFYQNMNGTIAYSSAAENASFAIYVEDDNRYTEQQVIDAYLAQVKNVYGSQVTSETKTYGGHEYTVMDIDATDGSYVGQAVILCEGTTLVYLEYVSRSGDESKFEDIMNSITF